MKRLIISILVVLVLVVAIQQNVSAVPLTYYRYLTVYEETRFDEIIWFWTYDSLFGPLRSSDFIGLKYSPHFYDYVITSEDRFVYQYPQNIHFEYPPIFNAPEYTLPEHLSDLADQADTVITNDNGRLMTRVVLQGEDGIEIHQLDLGRRLPDPGEEDRLVQRGDPPDNEVIYIDGQCEVYGVLNGRLVIYSTNNMFLIDNVIYEGVDPRDGDFDEDDMEHMLGLVSDRNIIIRDNYRNGRNDGFRQYGQYQIDHHSIAINASLVTLRGSFTFEHQNDDWEPYQGTTPDERGIIHLKGSVAQWRRGSLHRSNHIGTGYGKHIRYDERLRNQALFGLDMYDDHEFFGIHDTLIIDQEFSRFFSLNVRKLIIRPGSEIELYGDNALTVSDTLLVLGTANEPVQFSFTRCDSSALSFRSDTTFIHIQHAEFDSTVVLSFDGDSSSIENCIFHGPMTVGGDARLTGSTFLAPVNFSRSGDILIERCVVRDGIEFQQRQFSGRVFNNTITGSENRAGLKVGYARLDVINNIITDNYRGIWVDNVEYMPNLGYNDIFGNSDSNYVNCEPGEGSISQDPLFVDAENGDYRLQIDSPCIDAGDPDSPRDPDGSRADMGAFPFVHEGIVESDPSLVRGFTVEAFPNPFNRRASLNLFSEVSGLVYVKIFDLTGREVTNEVQRVSVGENRIKLDVRKLGGAGVYIALVMVAGESRTVKLVYLP